MGRVTTDVVTQATFLGADDRKRERERAGHRKKTALPDAIAGPCCSRCGLWRSPEPGEAYGECRFLVIVLSYRADEREVLSWMDAHERGAERTEPLRTAAGFVCSAFREKA